MSSQARDTYADAAAIVARIPRAKAARQMAAEVDAHVDAFERLSDESHAEVVGGIERNLRRWWRFLSTGVMPPSSDFDPLRAWARARAGEGVRLEDMLCSFGLTHQLGWQLLRRYAHDDESDVLVELAGLVAEYTDRVSAVVTEAYLAEREVLVTEDERRARGLLERICIDGPLEDADRELAERMGITASRPSSVFAIVLGAGSQQRPATLAARLRRAGPLLAVTEGEHVLGLAWRSLGLQDLGERGEVLLAVGEPTSRAGLAEVRAQVTALADYGRRRGLRGVLDTGDHLLEILIERSPALAARLHEKILAPLEREDRGVLAQTLRTLVDCRFDRTATSAALHVHRNTLAYRLGRIEQLIGVDLSSSRDLACVHVAIETAPAPTSD